MIPNIVNIGCNTFSYLFTFLCILLLEVLQNEVIGEWTVEFDCCVHCDADNYHAYTHAGWSDQIDEELAAEVEHVAVGEDDKG